LSTPFPNFYGDVYERFQEENAMRATQGLPPKKDSLFEHDLFKNVREARDRGDRSDKSIWPGHAFGNYTGGAFDWYGQPRTGPMCLTQVSEPVSNWPGPFVPGAQPCLGNMPILYPW
jgi:hypothetical protein